MPSPRAVLADIHNLSLDPSKAWSSLDKGGRLRPSSTVASHTSAADVREDVITKELVSSTPEVVEKEPEVINEVAEHVVVNEVLQPEPEENSDVPETSSTDFSENLDFNSELDSFRPKKKKK